MTAFTLPVSVSGAVLSRVAVKALSSGDLSSYADNGTAADAEIIIAQFDSEIALQQAQLRIIGDRVEEIQRQTERMADEAAQRARDEVLASVWDEIASLGQQITDIEAEIERLQSAQDEWYAIMLARQADELPPPDGRPVPPPPALY